MYEQEVVKLSGMERFIYINKISDEKIKLSLIKYFLEEGKEVWAYSTINKFKNEELIFEGLKQLKDEFYKKRLAELLTNIELIEKALIYIESDYDKHAIIEKIKNPNDRIKLLKYVTDSKFIKKILEEATDDDLKIEYILGTLKDGRYSDDIYNVYIGTISSLDKKLELARKTIDYEKQVGKKYFQQFMLYFIFENSKKIESGEDANYIISKFKEVLNDEKLERYVDSYTLSCLFKNFYNDELLLIKLRELEKDELVNKFITREVIFTVIATLSSKRLGLEILKQYYENSNLEIDVVHLETIILNHISDIQVLYDANLMSFIYKNLDREYSIANLIAKNIFGKQNEIFKLEELKYIQDGKLEELLNKYKNVGFIDNETLKVIFDITSKYIKNLTFDEMIQKIVSNSRLKEILELITSENRRNSVMYERLDGTLGTSYECMFDKFASIFPRTRFNALPDYIALKKMNYELCSKFNVKTWNQLISNPLFNQNDNSKIALVEIIAMAGLFENDENVEVRKRQIISLFSNYRVPFNLDEVYINMGFSNFKVDEYFENCNITKYSLREGVVIPENLRSFLKENFTEKQFERLRREIGNIGSELTKFISPYVKTETGWKLRNGIDIGMFSDVLKEEMTNAEYTHLLHSNDTPQEIKNFLNPYQKVSETGFMIRSDLSSKKYSEILEIILKSNVKSVYTFENIHRIFDGLELRYDPEFYNFFIEYQDQILENPRNQGRLKEIQKKFYEIKNYFAIRGNDAPSYNDMLRYLENIPYDITFGNEEFAQDAKNTNVSKEGYAFYEKLLLETRKRKLTTVPRHEKIYEYVAPDGKKYQVMAKVLRADDPFNLLVGESKFTNCCQKYNNAGQSCMIHASTSQNGGIFATYLIVDGVPQMLTQSWFWTNETKACLDNVEATSLITSANGANKRLLQDIATFAIKKSCEDIMRTSKESIDEYIKEKTRKILNSTLSDAEKQERLRELEIIRQRQTINIITVGEGCDDLRVRDSFPETEPSSLSYGPKGYIGYRDSNGGINHKQHVIIKSGDVKLPIDLEYEDIPIYRDDRLFDIEIGHSIRFDTLRKITDIESIAHKLEMRQYTESDGKFTIVEPQLLSRLYGCRLENLKIIHGEDWYYVYSNDYNQIEVYDLAKSNPRLEDESFQQTVEISNAFEIILSDSIVVDENGNIKYIKPIKADLREDTSYLLYLMQIKRGVIEQIGDDLAYSYSDENRKNIIITKEKQNEILANRKKIKEEENPSLTMHSVVFKPTLKEIEKILSKKNKELKSKGK